MEEYAQLSAESIRQFQEGISLTLSTWDALCAGIENGFGNPAQIQDFQNSIFDFFHQPNRKEIIYIDDLEELLWNKLVSIGIIVEDGSIDETAWDLMDMYADCLKGQYQSIQKLRDLKGALSSVVRQVVDASDDDDDEDDDMMVDSEGSLPNGIPTPVQKNESRPQQSIDEDGWVTVPSRKNRGRNH